MQYTSLLHNTVHNTTQRNTSLNSNMLYCATLHETTLHYTTLQRNSTTIFHTFPLCDRISYCAVPLQYSSFLPSIFSPHFLVSSRLFQSLLTSCFFFFSLRSVFSFLHLSYITLFLIPPDSDLSHLFFQLTHLISSHFFLAAYFLFPVHEHRVCLFHVPVLQGGATELCWGQKGNAIDSCEDKFQVENLKIHSCIPILYLKYGQRVPHLHFSNSDGSNLIPSCSILLAALLFSVQDYSTLQYTALQYPSLNVTYCTFCTCHRRTTKTLLLLLLRLRCTASQEWR